MSETIYYPTATTLVTSNTTITGNATIGVDRTNAAAYLVPSTSNAAVITQWIQRIVNNNGSPYWSNVSLYSSITLSPSVNYSYRGACVIPDGRVIFQPYSQTNIGIFSPATNSFTTFSTGIITNYYFSGPVLLPDGRVLFGPAPGVTNIGLFNPATNSFTTFSSVPAYSYTSSVLGPDGNVYFAPGSSTNIGIFNPKTNSFTTFSTGVTAGSYEASVLAVNGLIVMGSDGNGAATNIATFNPVTQVFTTYTSPYSYIGGCNLSDGRVIFTPANATNYGIFNPISGSFTTVSNRGNSGNDAYNGCALLPDGRVISFPCRATVAEIYNPVTNSFSTITVTGSSLFAGFFEGGCVLPDGRIVCVPYSGGQIGIISGLNRPVPREFCLHPFFNKF